MSLRKIARRLGRSLQGLEYALDLYGVRIKNRRRQRAWRTRRKREYELEGQYVERWEDRKKRKLSERLAVTQ